MSVPVTLFVPVSEGCWGNFGKREDGAPACAPIFAELAAALEWLKVKDSRLECSIAEYQLDGSRKWAHVAWHELPAEAAAE